MKCKITGVKSIERAYRELPKRVASKVVRQALRQALRPMLAAVKQEAPVETGQTKRAAKIRAVKVKKRGTIALEVRIGEGDYKGDQFYAAFVQYGHDIARPRGTVVGHVPPNPFMTRAFDRTKDQATREAIRLIAEGVDREVKALSKG